MIITKFVTLFKFWFAMTPRFRARAALFRWLWVMAGGLCLRLTAGNVFLCMQWEKISFLLFRERALVKIWYFSSKQSLHTLYSGVYGFTFLMVSHWMVYSIFLSFSSQMCSLSFVVYSIFLSFSSQMCSLSFVSFFLCTSLNDDLCWLYLVLNWLSVSPILLFWFFVVVSVTVVSYITHFAKHFIQWAACFFSEVAEFYTVRCIFLLLCSCNKYLLWFMIICFTFDRRLL